MSLYNIADIFLVRSIKSLDNFLFNIFISFAIYSWVLSSAHEPFAILRKFMYSLLGRKRETGGRKLEKNIFRYGLKFVFSDLN